MSGRLDYNNALLEAISDKTVSEVEWVHNYNEISGTSNKILNFCTPEKCIAGIIASINVDINTLTTSSSHILDNCIETSCYRVS